MEKKRKFHEMSESESAFGDIESGNEIEQTTVSVGENFQAVCPEFEEASSQYLKGLEEKSLTLWLPTKEIPDQALEEFVSLAKDQYKYSEEQALSMLLWHKHNLAKARADLDNFTPFPDEWTEEDKIMFKRGFELHGKNFDCIKNMLPEKSMKSIIHYYYLSKKGKFCTSKFQKQAKRLTARKKATTSKLNLDKTLSEDSACSNEPKGKGCKKCSVICNSVNMSSRRGLCSLCYQNWKRAGTNTTSELETESPKSPLPSSINLIYEDLAQMASGDNEPNELYTLDREIISLKLEAQQNKLEIIELQETLLEHIRKIEESVYSEDDTGETNEETFHDCEENPNIIMNNSDPQTQFHMDGMYTDLEDNNGPEIATSQENEVNLDLSKAQAYTVSDGKLPSL